MSEESLLSHLQCLRFLMKRPAPTADTDSYCRILTNQNTTTIFMKILGLSSFDIGLAHLVASLKENIQSSKPLFQKEKLVAN